LTFPVVIDVFVFCSLRTILNVTIMAITTKTSKIIILIIIIFIRLFVFFFQELIIDLIELRQFFLLEKKVFEINLTGDFLKFVPYDNSVWIRLSQDRILQTMFLKKYNLHYLQQTMENRRFLFVATLME